LKDPEEATPFADAMPTRRRFLTGAVGIAAASSLPIDVAAAYQTKGAETSGRGQTFFELVRVPDLVQAFKELKDPQALIGGGERWTASGVEVETAIADGQVSVSVRAEAKPIRHVHLRWRGTVSPELLLLGDAWERSYGDLEWRNMVPDRVMPWYFGTWDGAECHAYGVKTQAGAMCFWQADPDGVSLWLDLSNGGLGVLLGQRKLLAATVISRRGQKGESPTGALRAFCKQMCLTQTRPAGAIYGTNDWYYAYGKNTAERILSDTEYIASLSEGNEVRPFSVVDMGWSIGTASFPSMADLAVQIRARRVRPGIWIRPLEASERTDAKLLLPRMRFGKAKAGQTKELAYDPTVPEALEAVLAKVTQVVDWGYELVKHDFSTYDLLGQWGFEMGAEPTAPGWSLHDRTRTNAEVIHDLYQGIRSRCGQQRLILGCNTVGHLGQGIFDVQRTGDDTSGRIWERTRRMGVNTLAFRLPQHGSFFVQDADCVGISPAIPWKLNLQWMKLIAQSGTALFLSPGDGSRGLEQAREIREAFSIAAAGGSGVEPQDWREQTTPQRWATAGGTSKSMQLDWYGEQGAFPFMV
jgi:alpha-galactosidase